MENIVGAISAAKNANTGMAISMAIARKALDTVQVQGEMFVEDIRSMELSINPNIGSKFDTKI